MTVQKPAMYLRLAGALLLLAAVQYVLLEYITASAWHAPAHSYAVNFISDLGNPVPGDTFDGRVINSPLHVVMDVAFVAQGVLYIAGGLLLLAAFQGGPKRLLRSLVFAHGAGVILVGFFPESSGALRSGLIMVHGLAAAVAIVAGNVVPIVVGVCGLRRGASAQLCRVAVALGAAGLAAFVLLQADRPLYHAAGGVPERVSVYTIVAFEIVIGATVLARASRMAPALPVPATAGRLAI